MKTKIISGLLLSLVLSSGLLLFKSPEPAKAAASCYSYVTATTPAGATTATWEPRDCAAYQMLFDIGVPPLDWRAMNPAPEGCIKLPTQLGIPSVVSCLEVLGSNEHLNEQNVWADWLHRCQEAGGTVVDSGPNSTCEKDGQPVEGVGSMVNPNYRPPSEGGTDGDDPDSALEVFQVKCKDGTLGIETNTKIGGSTCVASQQSSDVSINPIVILLKEVLAFITIGVGVVITISIIWAGITYASAGDHADKTAEAKGRIWNAVIALLMYVFMFAILQWLIPGGIF